jgi:hypothetical protein
MSRKTGRGEQGRGSNNRGGGARLSEDCEERVGTVTGRDGEAERRNDAQTVPKATVFELSRAVALVVMAR